MSFWDIPTGKCEQIKKIDKGKKGMLNPPKNKDNSVGWNAVMTLEPSKRLIAGGAEDGVLTMYSVKSSVGKRFTSKHPAKV